MDPIIEDSIKTAVYQLPGDLYQGPISNLVSNILELADRLPLDGAPPSPEAWIYMKDRLAHLITTAYLLRRWVGNDAAKRLMSTSEWCGACGK
jgi:hypothetical protein